MQMTQLAGKLARNDAKLVWRDRFLVFMFFFVLYIAIALRFGLPWLNTYLAENGLLPSETIPQSLADFYPLLVAFMAIFQGALISGTIFGFALLDEKEDNTIKAMLVTPMPFSHYLLFRIAVPTILAAFIVVAMVLFINQALLPLWQLILISAGGALTAPIISLFFATFAENKVQGFALSKFGGVSAIRRARDLCTELGTMMVIEDTWGSDITTAAVAHLAVSTAPKYLLNACDLSGYVSPNIAPDGPRRENASLRPSERRPCLMIPSRSSRFANSRSGGSLAPGGYCPVRISSRSCSTISSATRCFSTGLSMGLWSLQSTPVVPSGQVVRRVNVVLDAFLRDMEVDL